MTIQTKNKMKRVTSGLCITAFIGALSACSGSGSPAAPATGGETGGGDNGGNPPIDTCLGVGIPKPNVLFPTHPSIKYQYFTDDADSQETILDYQCAEVVKNGTTSTSLYPLDYKINLKGEDNKDISFTVTELMSSTSPNVLLHGYKIRDIPLSVIAPDSTRKINVDILPENPLIIYSDQFVEKIQNKHIYGETKLRFAGLNNDDIANVIKDLVPTLRKEGFLEGIDDAQIDLGLFVLKGLDPAGRGLLVNASGYSTLVKDAEPVTWGPGPNPQKSGSAQEIQQVMKFAIKSSDYGLPVNFGFEIEVAITMQLLPNVGPVLRQFDVKTTQIGNKEESAADADTVKEEAVQAEEQSGFGSLNVGVKLIAIQEGDSDNDDIVDVLDDNIENETSESKLTDK